MAVVTESSGPSSAVMLASGLAEALGKNLVLVHEVEKLAQDKGCTPAQLALAWVLSRGEHVVSIPGTRKISRLDENVAAASVGLTSADLDDLLDSVDAQG